MIPRHISPHLLTCAKHYPILAVVGPRQSGKTTLVRALFPNYQYISLENLDLRQYATDDPRGFLKDHGPYVIFDEVQRVPQIFSYLQEIVDQRQEPGQYILTGSSQFLLMQHMTQSLAGRIATFKLFPFSFLEVFQYPPDTSFDTIFRDLHQDRTKIEHTQLLGLLRTGFYPRIYDKDLDSFKWHENYVATYVERDIRYLLNVKNLRTFENFLKLCASQSGQLLNYTNLSNAVGVSIPTIKEWISILETSGIIFILPPFFKNFSKRIIKTPKMYFVDTGLLCYLLTIRSTEVLKTHPLLGQIFETFLVSECFKRFHHMGEIPPLYFWRDQTGNEIDLLLYDGNQAFPIEIKLSQTFKSSFKETIERFLLLKDNPTQTGTVVYCGEHISKSPISIAPWYLL